MEFAIPNIPLPYNELVKNYSPGSTERHSIGKALETMAGQQIDMPLVIDGQEIRTKETSPSVMPHDHQHVLGRYHHAGSMEIDLAIQAALKARSEWSALGWEGRSRIFLKAADLVAGPWRDRINGSTMLGQSKTIHQAEIDAACEMVDFFRFNVHFYQQLLAQQPHSGPGVWNQLEHRPLEGFVFAVSPFNFTSIAANLTCAPALLGNTIVWKPAGTSALSAHYIMQMLMEAGLPPGVINLVYGSGSAIGSHVLGHSELSGIHFTGSTSVFQSMWKTVASNLTNYRDYPRLVGETGGKDFILAHPSADREALKTAMIRGAFEYQGQKCSAASRAYIPKSIWKDIKKELVDIVNSIPMGDVRDFSNFMGAVIDEASFKVHQGAIAAAQQSGEASIVAGGQCDGRKGYFVRPTIIETQNPKYNTMCEELFGPILSVYVYDDKDWDGIFSLVDQSTPYALTGAIFSQDRIVVQQCLNQLRYSAGNFYINDKPTGAMVGQQPFGGARASGTNDKGGSILNLLRWVSPRTIKETFVPPTDYKYPYMDSK